MDRERGGGGERYRLTNTDRQTHRQINRRTDRWTGTQTDKNTNRQYRQICCGAETERPIEKYRNRPSETKRQTERQAQEQTKFNPLTNRGLCCDRLKRQQQAPHANQHHHAGHRPQITSALCHFHVDSFCHTPGNSSNLWIDICLREGLFDLLSREETRNSSH